MTSAVMHKGPRRARGRPGVEVNMGPTGTLVERLQLEPCTRSPSVHGAGRGRREGNVRLHCSTCATVPALLLHHEYLMSHKSRRCSQEMRVAPLQRSAALGSSSHAHACCLTPIHQSRRILFQLAAAFPRQQSSCQIGKHQSERANAGLAMLNQAASVFLPDQLISVQTAERR